MKKRIGIIAVVIATTMLAGCGHGETEQPVQMAPSNVEEEKSTSEDAALEVAEQVNEEFLKAAPAGTSIEDTKTYQIDCGKDGENELLVKTSFTGGSEPFSTYVIIKKYDDEYRACYIKDVPETDEYEINIYGYIDEVCVGSEGTIYYTHSFVDKDGDYYSFYTKTKYNSASAFGGIEAASEDWDDVLVEVYDLSDESDGSDVFCTYYKMDEYYDTYSDEEMFKEGSVYRKAFDDAGLKVVDYTKVSGQLSERKTVIGLTDEVIEGRGIDSLFYDMVGTYRYDDGFSCGNNGTLEIKAEEEKIYVSDYVDEWEDYRFEITEADIVKETAYGVYVKCSKVNEKSDDNYFYFESVEYGIDVYCCDEEGNTTYLLYNAQ